MADKIHQGNLQRMRNAYKKAFEGLLLVAPELELTQRNALEENFMRRFFARIELRGVEPDWDLNAVAFKITAAKLGIVNSRRGWEDFLYNRRTTGTMLL